MHEQTHFRSIQWRIDLARARVLRAQLRDFFDRSLARFDTARLEESMYSGITEAAEMRPSLWTRIRSGIQTPFAARRSNVTETPKRKTSMPKRNLYGKEPVAANNSISPPLPPRNTLGTNSRGDDCYVSIDDDQMASADSNTASFGTFQSPEENLTKWASALESTPSDEVVRVSFNPNDADAIVVMESTDVNSSAADINSQAANESNVDNASQMPLSDSMAEFEKAVDESLYRALQNVREETARAWEEVSVTQEESQSSDSKEFLKTVFENAQRQSISKALYSHLKSYQSKIDTAINSAFSPSDGFPSEFLEQHMSVGSTMEIPDMTGLSPQEQNSSIKSPFVPLANSSPNSSYSSASDGENNETVREVSDEQSPTQQEVSSEDSIPPPLADVSTPVRPAPPVPGAAAQAAGAIPKKQRKKKEWPKTSDYNLRSKKNKE
jgi:hypothetical protein